MATYMPAIVTQVFQNMYIFTKPQYVYIHKHQSFSVVSL